MDLDRDELEELVAFFAKRFGDPEERAALLAAVGVADGEWSTVIPNAGDRLGAIAAEAAVRRPKDPNLAELDSTLNATAVPLKVAIAAGAALLLIAVGAAAWYGTADEHIEKRQPDSPPEVVVEAIEAPVVAPIIPNVAPQELPSEPVEEALPAEPIADPLEGSAPAPEQTVTDGRCGGPSGTIVGYWYAGFPFEAEIGEVYTLKFGKYVRADYPRKANSWSSEEAIHCSLQAGDQIRLSQAAVLVDGGKFWVPLAAGDLITP